MMSLPFSEQQFLRIFAEYNRAVWPSQLLLFSLAALALFLAAGSRRKQLDKLIGAILALLWLWMGVVYHILFFTAINKAAYAFGALFILQSLLFVVAAVVQKPSLTFRFRPDLRGFGGAALFAYALIGYPVLGYALGHAYPAAPTFGVPCPTTIFTFGMLLWVDGHVPARLLLIPLGWTLVAAMATVSLGMIEDFGLMAAGVFTTIALLILRNHRVRGLKPGINPAVHVEGFSNGST